jgi:sigma-E factor negative regulatory protein RseC
MTGDCLENGHVQTVSGNQAVVVVTRTEACGACAARGACHALGGQKEDLAFTLDNEIGAQEGDTVAIRMPSDAIVRISAILYLVPALALLAGAAGGFMLASSAGWEGDAGTIVGAVAGLLSGFGLSRLLGTRLRRRGEGIPRMTAIVNRREETADECE